jgi:hypothetical protein
MVLRDLRAGVDVIDLREAARELRGPARATVLAALKRVADHFRSLLRRAEHVGGAELLTSLEAAIASLAKEPPSPARLKALTAATGLRAELFPPDRGAAELKGSVS